MRFDNIKINRINNV